MKNIKVTLYCKKSLLWIFYLKNAKKTRENFRSIMLRAVTNLLSQELLLITFNHYWKAALAVMARITVVLTHLLQKYTVLTAVVISVCVPLTAESIKLLIGFAQTSTKFIVTVTVHGFLPKS